MLGPYGVKCLQVVGKRLNETLAILNVPGMSKKTFISIENQIGVSWGKILSEEIIRLAKKRKN